MKEVLSTVPERRRKGVEKLFLDSNQITEVGYIAELFPNVELLEVSN
jgi:hypothetical protein